MLIHFLRSDFYAWNPAVKADCSGLMSGMYVCIGLKGAATTITTGTPVAAASTSTALNFAPCHGLIVLLDCWVDIVRIFNVGKNGVLQGLRAGNH